jgi:hypothetical protein
MPKRELVLVTGRRSGQDPSLAAAKQEWKEAIEDLESSQRLAKQVLSQLSYTPALTSASFQNILRLVLSALRWTALEVRQNARAASKLDQFKPWG